MRKNERIFLRHLRRYDFNTTTPHLLMGIGHKFKQEGDWWVCEISECDAKTWYIKTYNGDSIGVFNENNSLSCVIVSLYDNARRAEIYEGRIENMINIYFERIGIIIFEDLITILEVMTCKTRGCDWQIPYVSEDDVGYEQFIRTLTSHHHFFMRG